jgi:ABC-type phosphate transport system substrate-binding protein
VIGQSWVHGIVVRFILAVVIFFHAIPETFAQEVVVNPSVPEIKLSRSALRAIFSMRLRTWSDGSVIRVFVLDNRSSLHAKFSKKILSIFPYQLQRTWDRLVYSGTGQAPTEVKSIEDMHDKIASTPGAIGYLTDKSIDSQVRKVEVVQFQ